MHSMKDLLTELATLNDTLHVRAHLFGLELKDDWHSLQVKVEALETKLEHKLVDVVEKLGHAESHFYIDSDEDLEALVDEFRDFKDKVDE